MACVDIKRYAGLDGRWNMSWGQVQMAMEELIREVKTSGFVPEDIVIVAKGGLVPGAILAQAFPKANLHIIRTYTYGEKGGRQTKTVIAPVGYKIPTRATLVIDDICDSGQTFSTLDKFFMGQSIEDMPGVKFAAMLVRDTTSFEYDFGGYYIGCGWVVFPWESDAPIQGEPSVEGLESEFKIPF